MATQTDQAISDLDEASITALAEHDAARAARVAVEHDRVASWTCSCCHQEIRLLRGATVIHGTSSLRLAWTGVTVNGEPVAA
ncbi:MAG: hypothetical protein ACYDBQ_06080 [Thermoplasmatota archaeon]